MKTNLKRISKRSLALILGILMLFSTLMIGSFTTNAEGSSYYMHWGNKDSEYNNLLEMPSSGTNTYSANLSVTQSTNYFIKINASSTDSNSSLINGSTKLSKDSVSTKFSWIELGDYSSVKILKFSPNVSFNLNVSFNTSTNTITLTEAGDTPEPTTTAATTAPASTWKVHANFDTSNDAWEDYPLNTVNGNVVSGTVEISETGDRVFGISGSDYYKEDNSVSTITRDSNSATLVKNGSNDAKITFDVAGTYTFAFNTNTGALTVTYPSTTPTETTSPTESTTPVTTTYYIAANEISSWGEFRALTVGGNGTYSYYQNTSDTLTFKIAAQASWSGGVYGFTKVDNNFNASNVELTSANSVEGQDKNIVCSVNPAYIIVYHPNTALNTTDTPKICAATSLPSGGQQYSITTTNDTHSRVVVQSSAAAGATVSFTLRFDPGYELNTITVAGQAVTPDTTGTYTFEMPANDVTISVTSKASQVVVTNKYYIRGNVYGVNNWNDSSAAMTISDDGFYEYYYVSDGTDAEFLIDKDDTKGTNGSYNYQNINSMFNGTNVAVTSKYSTDNGNKNIFVENASSAYYIIVYYPNTTVNTSNAPIICAATTKPSGLQQTVNVVAKDGTNSAKFALMANTTITAVENVVTNVTDDADKEFATATAKAGKEITITTTINAENKADYLVKGWVVNGESVGIRSTDTATDDGVYTTTFTIDPLWIGDNGNLEITPVFFHVTNDTNKNDFITFYVEDFNKGANETWGNTVACYPYYYTGNGTEAKEDFGAYPGQPMLKGAGDRYYVQIAKTCEEKAISGITLNNYQYDTKHAELFSLSNNLQTYDYDDFVKILEAHPDATNIAFKFKFNGDNDNEPSTTSYASDATITAAGKGGWEDLKNYNGDSLTNIYGTDISNDTTNYLRVISNGYDSATGYIGQYATCWYVYAPNASGGWDYVTKIAPSALVFEDAEALGNSDASSFVDAYNTLQQYSDYAVKIAYEGNANKSGVSDYKRCDGKWYYTIKGQEIVGNILIQYENSAIADRGTYEYDTYTGTGVGTVTGANPHFTNAEATDPHTFVTTLDNDKQFTFTTDATSGSYKFIGWYILESEGAEPTFYTKDIDASAVRNKSFTFVARYNYVDEIAEIHITYNFKDFHAVNGEIAYTTDHDKSKDTPNSYTTNDTLIVAYANNDEEIAKIVAKNAPMIHSDYYDYSLNNASINYSSIVKDGKTHVYATATMDDTPHVYSVTVNGQKFTGYYQNTLELYADDFGLTYSDGATALWYLVDGTNETLYYDKFDLNYRFIVDKAELKVVANDGNKKSLDGKSVVYNSYYELGYKENVQKITQNFYITDYLDYAYNDAGEVVEGAKNIKYVGGGILYYSSDENGVAQNDTAAAALANKEAIINSALSGTYTSDKNGTVDKVGYVYSKYDPAKFRYSEFLIAYQHIIGITLNNKDANAGKHISAYSFFVYTYQDGKDTYTQIQISDTMAVATAYEPN